MKDQEEFYIHETEHECVTHKQDHGKESKYQFLSFILRYNFKHRAIK